MARSRVTFRNFSQRALVQSIDGSPRPVPSYRVTGRTFLEFPIAPDTRYPGIPDDIDQQIADQQQQQDG